MTNKNLPKPLGKNGFKYREQYGVIVICADEKQQESIFNDLKKQGHKCKVVTV
ncbi:hypothetical protein [Marinomonas sp. S3726]|uniref:hypothetical protein n=1 Tax=Marinomonas sp. S3726 TaxID=579484 RepID=UPI000AA85BEA|nr:hypothetical protein [Marinomonas sp. S3726]